MTYDNTDERGEDAVARQRGGSERPPARDTVASLRKGDEVEIIYRGTVSRVCDDDVALSDDERWCLAPHDVRIIKRAPLTEPPIGSGWFHDGVLWVRAKFSIGDEGPWHDHSEFGQPRWRFWADLQPGHPAVPAAAPGGDDE